MNKERVQGCGNAPIFVSIHANKFPIAKYRGIQVFYSPNDKKSEALAILIRENVIENLGEHNDRAVKKADTSIYVLDRAKCPAVLIECGFMSNPDDFALMTSEAYQEELAFVIANSIMEYINL